MVVWILDRFSHLSWNRGFLLGGITNLPLVKDYDALGGSTMHQAKPTKSQPRPGLNEFVKYIGPIGLLGLKWPIHDPTPIVPFFSVCNL